MGKVDMKKGGARLFLATSLLALAAAAQGNELVTYSYDSLGRLTRVSRSGSANTPVTAEYAYDAADNRTNVTVATGSPPPSSPSTPPPSSSPSPPGNQPPVAVNDSGGEVMRCAYMGVFDPLTNDYDPEGTQLDVVAASYSGSLGTAMAARSQLRFMPNNSGTGTAVITYTIGDAEGATASGTYTLEVVQGQCW
jgi:hypothetical protein